jgi:hypothetical protein
MRDKGAPTGPGAAAAAGPVGLYSFSSSKSPSDSIATR